VTGAPSAVIELKAMVVVPEGGLDGAVELPVQPVAVTARIAAISSRR